MRSLHSKRRVPIAMTITVTSDNPCLVGMFPGGRGLLQVQKAFLPTWRNTTVMLLKVMKVIGPATYDAKSLNISELLFSFSAQDSRVSGFTEL